MPAVTRISWMTSGERRRWFSKMASWTAHILPLSRASSVACAAGMELGCWVRGKLIQQSLTFEALSAANFSRMGRRTAQWGHSKSENSTRVTGSLAAALPLVDLEGLAGVAKALVVPGELDADLGGGDAAAGLDGGELGQAPAVPALRMALDALPERVRRAAAAELVLERPVVLCARGRRERRGVDGGRVRRSGEGGRRPRALQRHRKAGRGSGPRRPCYTSARRSCKTAVEAAETGGHACPNVPES